MIGRLSNFSSLRRLTCFSSNLPQSSNILPPSYKNGNLEDRKEEKIVNRTCVLPGYNNNVRIYSFPELTPKIMEVPTTLNELLDKMDPLLEENKNIEEPSNNKISPLYCGPRLMTIRRKKMKKHKRRRRYDRDYHKYQKFHRQKKLKAEKKFRQQMAFLIKDMEEFNPKDFVNQTIEKAKLEWNTKLAPSGKKKYPHWSQLMSIEELYGIEKNSYIDKNYGYPGEEGKQQLDHLRKEYIKKYTKK
uniref:DUF1713 domain-containing protein n=1 Tax=Parastrongyloides trichosuri TaxID=131310 RepID=A0A0N4ZKS4_PARTI